MFVAKTITVWSEAVKMLIEHPQFPGRYLKDAVVSVEYPMAKVQYPSLWVNYSMQGDMKNVGIGHEESVTTSGLRRGLRWQFGGVAEITVSAMSNLERARMLDELTASIAVARVDENPQGIFREHIERNDLLGQIVTWESLTVTGFGEAQGTPWGTDDVIYEATVSLVTSGEVLLDPDTAELLPLSGIEISAEIDLDAETNRV